MRSYERSDPRVRVFTFSNNSASYRLNGSGSLSGTGGIAKYGAGAVTLALPEDVQAVFPSVAGHRLAGGARAGALQAQALLRTVALP